MRRGIGSNVDAHPMKGGPVWGFSKPAFFRWRRGADAPGRSGKCVFGEQLPESRDLPERRQHGHLVEARRESARLGDLLGVPVAVEVELVLEKRELGEVEPAVGRAQESPPG